MQGSGQRFVDGSSPLTRGKPHPTRNSRSTRRLIPAHAGKTLVRDPDEGETTAHPRSRGENAREVVQVCHARGSSPLTRGKPGEGWQPPRLEGLIPAHAGKTIGKSCVIAPPQAHPRSRGENAEVGPVMIRDLGSSPLTRGKRTTRRRAPSTGGLIPAHAGKTGHDQVSRVYKRAHPRSRGENPY